MEGHAPFSTQRRIHMGLAVRDLASSIRFYESLFGTGPSKRRPGYAKFEPADPSVNLSLVESPSLPRLERPAAEHYGVQVRSTDAVGEAKERLDAAGIATEVEEATSCCYAVQDKVWATDPDGHRWEVFVVLDPDSPELRSVKSDCCADETTGCCDTATGCCG